MRKAKKRKLRSCPMCKPNKTGGATRWTVREFCLLRSDEREIAEARRF